MNGNIGKQQLEANTTLPSAAKLARIVRPDPDAFALTFSVFHERSFCRLLIGAADSYHPQQRDNMPSRRALRVHAHTPTDGARASDENL